MKTIKKLVFLIFAFLLVLFVQSSSIVKAQKKSPDMSVDQDFSLNSVCVILTNYHSTLSKKYTVDDFKEVNPDYIIIANTYSYDLVNRYVNGENVDLKNIKIDTFQTDISLFWNEEKTKEEIIEIVHTLEKRNDVYYTSPNYLAYFQSGVYNVGADETVWTNFYRIKVLEKNFDKYVDNDGNNIYSIKAQILDCYDDLVNIKTSIDKLVSNTKQDDIIEFGILEKYYKVLQCGYEYIMQFSFEEIEINYNNKHQDLLISYKKNTPLVPIFDNKLFFNSGFGNLLYTQEELKEIEYGTPFYNGGYSLGRLFIDYAFKCRAGSSDELAEYFDFAYNDWGETFIYKTDDEEIIARIKDEVGMPYNCDLYYAIFLIPGDDILMFNEYIKLAANVRNSSIYKLSECADLRKQALENIKANK